MSDEQELEELMNSLVVDSNCNNCIQNQKSIEQNNSQLKQNTDVLKLEHSNHNHHFHKHEINSNNQTNLINEEQELNEILASLIVAPNGLLNHQPEQTIEKADLSKHVNDAINNQNDNHSLDSRNSVSEISETETQNESISPVEREKFVVNSEIEQIESELDENYDIKQVISDILDLIELEFENMPSTSNNSPSEQDKPILETEIEQAKSEAEDFHQEHQPSPQQQQQQIVDNEYENVTPIEITDFVTEWSGLTESEKTLGLIAPVWLSDSETEICMKCEAKFTFRKRRHHCRACGLIFCSNCCGSKLPLPYKLAKVSSANDDDELNENGAKVPARVCVVCYETINKGKQDLKIFFFFKILFSLSRKSKHVEN